MPKLHIVITTCSRPWMSHMGLLESTTTIGSTQTQHACSMSMTPNTPTWNPDKGDCDVLTIYLGEEYQLSLCWFHYVQTNEVWGRFGMEHIIMPRTLTQREGRDDWMMTPALTEWWRFHPFSNHHAQCAHAAGSDVFGGIHESASTSASVLGRKKVHNDTVKQKWNGQSLTPNVRDLVLVRTKVVAVIQKGTLLLKQ